MFTWRNDDWYSDIPQKRADLYYSALKKILNIKDNDLKAKTHPEADKELIELLRKKLDETRDIRG